jgi:hypothetical protein
MWSVVRVNVFVPVVARWVRKLHICNSNYLQRVILTSFLISWLFFSSHTVNTGMVMWGRSLEKTRTLVWCLGLVLWHYHWTWWTHCQGDPPPPQKKGNNKIGLFTIFANCGYIWLLALNRTEDCFDKTRDFSDIFDIQAHMMTIMKGNPEQQYFEQWKNWLTKCITVKRDYFEGDRNY